MGKPLVGRQLPLPGGDPNQDPVCAVLVTFPLQQKLQGLMMVKQ